MTHAERLLTQIEAQCRIARAALADEHEGNFRTAVVYLEGDATELLELVNRW
jgi:hypothetical protein